MTAPDIQRPRVLIVEDEHIVAADLERTLLSLGYSVPAIAETAKSAIRLAEEERPDLVLMDIQLRGSQDGITAAEEISRKWQIPIVFVTANTNDEVLTRARAVGPYGYVIKPFRSKEINATLLVALQQHRRVKELFSEHTWLRTMLGSLSDGVIATDGDARVRYLNPVGEKLTGWASAEAYGKPIEEVCQLSTFDGHPVPLYQLRIALSTKQPAEKQRFLLHRRDGSKIAIEDSASPVLEQDRAVGAVTVLLDVTDRLLEEQRAEEERDRLEEQVHLAAEALGQTRAELRALSGHLLAAQEDERRRMARDLHDDFGQRAAVLDMHAEHLSQLIPDEGEAATVLQTMRQQLRDLDRAMRSVSHRLHPSVLEHLGLVPGLQSLIQDFRHAGGEAILRTPEPGPEIPFDTALALYRIAQEALRNARRHAPGALVRVTLSATPQAFQLAVEDAGPGFDVAMARVRGGLGLMSMQERARLVGGTLLLRTRPGAGTLVTVRVPRWAREAQNATALASQGTAT